MLLEAQAFKHQSVQLCGRFPQNFKHVLLAEVRKYQRVGVKSIEIRNIATDDKSNLLVEFDTLVNPQYNALVRKALRRAVITLDVCSFTSTLKSHFYSSS